MSHDKLYSDEKLSLLSESGVDFHSLFMPRSVAVGGAAAFVYHKTALCNDAPVLHSGLKLN